MPTKLTSFHLKSILLSIRKICFETESRLLERTNYSFLPTGQGWAAQGWEIVSVLEALQFLPPLEGNGLEQVLVCVWFPLPQVTLQELHADQIDQFPSEIQFWSQWLNFCEKESILLEIPIYIFLPTGQGWEVQACDIVSVFEALQFLPPLAGDGFEQVLVCVRLPLPQVALQVLHADQIDQFPSEIHFFAHKIKILWESKQTVILSLWQCGATWQKQLSALRHMVRRFSMGTLFSLLGNVSSLRSQPGLYCVNIESYDMKIGISLQSKWWK